MGMREVSKEEFHAAINRANGQISSRKNETLWTTTHGALIGKTDRGYLPPNPPREERYFLSEPHQGRGGGDE